MRLHRFYIEENQGEWGENSLVIHDPMLLHQFIKVLRYTVDDHIFVFHETRGEYEVVFKTLTRKEALCTHVKHTKQAMQRSEEGVVLYVSLIKKDRFEWLIEKTTELGIKKIVPLISERTTTKNCSPERLRRISIEAIEQSQQVLPPEITEPMSVSEACALCHKNFAVLHTSLSADASTESVALGNSKNIFIGPEGGWGASDCELFKKHSATFIELHTPILRTETAAIIASYECLKK